MDYRLTFPVEPFVSKISYSHSLLLAGSCFAENIGDLMEKYAFSSYTNPFGILYNPLSLATMLQRCLSGEEFREDELFYHNGLWTSWQHHGSFSHAGKENCLQGINEAINKANNFIHNGQWLVVSFGAAFAYRLNNGGQLVGNCHKYPNREFTKVLITVDEIVTAWQQLIQKLKESNPALQIILTVSPVRYARDGVVQNNLSKAILLQAVHQLCDANTNVQYFPAYEFVNDDLRDYRFFKPDMVHPSEQAIEYVWNKFVDAGFDTETQQVLKEIQALISASQHRPINPESEGHQKFIRNNRERVLALQAKFPHLQLDALIAAFTTGQ